MNGIQKFLRKDKYKEYEEMLNIDNLSHQNRMLFASGIRTLDEI